MSSSPRIINYIENKGGGDKRRAGGAGVGSGAAKAREGAVIGAKEVVEATFPPLFQLVKLVSRMKW